MNDKTRLDAARWYLSRGWAPIPIPLREKNPGFDGWQTFQAAPENLERRFGRTGNIGVRLGKASSELVDIDLDCPEAVELADIYLPTTDAVFGRPSKPRSHRLYIATGATFEKFSDPLGERRCLLELRSDTAAGGVLQTVFPPSVHESGETVAWVSSGEPREFDAAKLRKCCAWLAVGCVIARYIPTIDPRKPWPGIAKALWRGYPGELSSTVYRWLGLYDPDAAVMARHVPSDTDIAKLTAMIPNTCDREGWVRVGLAIYGASGGSQEGLAAFKEFSRRSPRHHNDRTVERVWQSIAKSPPREIGAATLVYMAQRGAP